MAAGWLIEDPSATPCFLVLRVAAETRPLLVKNSEPRMWNEISVGDSTSHEEHSYVGAVVIVYTEVSSLDTVFVDNRNAH